MSNTENTVDVKKIVYCPICHRVVGTYNERATINFIARCNKCKKRVVRDVNTGEVVAKPLPKRETSSGKTFI